MTDRDALERDRDHHRGTINRYWTSDQQWACLAHGRRAMRDDPQAGAYCADCCRRYHATDRDETAAGLQLANAISAAVCGQAQPDPGDSYRQTLRTLAQKLIDELNRPDWEGSTVRELITGLAYHLDKD